MLCGLGTSIVSVFTRQSWSQSYFGCTRGYAIPAIFFAKQHDQQILGLQNLFNFAKKAEDDTLFQQMKTNLEELGIEDTLEDLQTRSNDDVHNAACKFALFFDFELAGDEGEEVPPVDF